MRHFSLLHLCSNFFFFLEQACSQTKMSTDPRDINNKMINFLINTFCKACELKQQQQQQQ